MRKRGGMIAVAWICLMAACALRGRADSGGAASGPDVVFQEDFRDPTLPRWTHGRAIRPPAAVLSGVLGPGGVPAVSLETPSPVAANLSAALPAARIAGKAVVLEVWRRAENVRTGARPYDNAKTMLSWKAKGAARPEYASTTYSDFSGTWDWQRHIYVVQMPQQLEWARVTIGMQDCMGKAAWSGLKVSIDPRFPNQLALDRFLARRQRELFRRLTRGTMAVRRLDGGVVQVFADQTYVPRCYWNEPVRTALLKSGEKPGEGPSPRPHGGFRAALAISLSRRAAQLEQGLKGLNGTALNDRVYEITSLRERARQLGRAGIACRQARVAAEAGSETPVSALVFGNNINAQNLTAPYDSRRGRFDEEFLRRVRPMGITFLRYPGGCNADIFNWKNTVGPLAKRGEILNYHNGTGRGIPRFGVDEFLRFCEQEGMVPVITTAFLKDRPENIDVKTHPQAGKLKYVEPYLKSAPERIELAADWVEYCNGAADTPLGRLRARNGHPQPYHVQYWEIGNESYGPDRVGSCTAEEYARAFPAYVEAMKARDPSIKIALNGCGSRPQWNDTLLRIAGRQADLFQIHIYKTPRIFDDTQWEGRPRDVAPAMRIADGIPAGLQELEAQMKSRLGHTLPVIVTEFGMGNARDRELMTSVTSAVLVADMLRVLVESPLVVGANKWCLYSGYWFSQVEGPTLSRLDAPYFIRPEQIMHEIYARCRADTRLHVNNDDNQGVKAVVFTQAAGYGVVLVSREPVDWQSVELDLPGAKSGRARCLLVTAGHPFLGNEADHDLVGKIEFEFDYTPATRIMLPSNSVAGLLIPR